MLDEKLQVLNAVGQALTERHGGFFHNFVATCLPRLFDGGKGLGIAWSPSSRASTTSAPTGARRASSGRILFWRPTQTMDAQVEHQVRISGVRDERGAPFDDHASTFVTGVFSYVDLHLIAD